MNEHRSSRRSDDLKRYGMRLNGYLLALEQTTEMLHTNRSNPIAYIAKDSGLLNLLPKLRLAFNSKGAFVADGKGTILIADPDDIGLRGKQVPITSQVTNLIEKGESLIVYEDSEDIPELVALSIRSLLMVRLETPWGLWLVGVCNGQNDPKPYLSEDRKFFDQMSRILSLMAFFSVDTSDFAFASDRYFWSRLRGEWDYLSRASEDYASAKIPLQRKEGAYRRDFEGAMPDVLLSDHLDAELCQVMRTLSKTSVDHEPRKQLEELMHLTQEEEKNGNIQIHFRVRLHDNRSETNNLEIIQFPQTALAAGRICMCLAYLDSGLRVPPKPKEPKLPAEKDSHWGLAEISPSDLFWTLPDVLLGNIAPTENGKSDPISEWQIDWARSLWQRAYYLASDSLVEPKEEWDNALEQIYKQIWPLTARILRSYLESQLSEEQLSIDSDWLIIWLANNVLLSKRMVEYYGLVSVKNESGENQQRVFSPAARMRFIAYLSQLILYTLHSVRHARRREEFKDPKHHRDYIRPSFADLPAGLSPSLSEAQLYILSEYAYREIGVSRELCIFERLVRQLYYELPLYASGSFYRDHLYHVIDVCLLGELLLRSTQSGEKKQSMVSTVAECAESGTPEKLLENWYIAALCHDLGYIVEQTDGLLKPVGEVKGKGIDEFLTEAQQGLVNGKSKLNQEILVALGDFPKDKVESIKGEIANVGATDHGVVGWLHLLHWLRGAHKKPSTYKHALTAILRHNLPDQAVNIHEEPLTFLLMLCDHLQEWGRPRIGPDPLARGIMEALRFSEQAELETKIRVRQLKVFGLGVIPPLKEDNQSEACADCIQGSNCQGSCLRLQTHVDKDGLKFELAHVEAIEGDFEPGISWFLLTRNLQCFSKSSLPYPITIALKHTPSRIWHILPGKPLELDLLQDFANSEKSVAYLCEWIEAARKHQKGVGYDSMNGHETFFITLGELDFPLRRGLSDDHWKEFRRWKWQRLGRQYITANIGNWWPE